MNLNINGINQSIDLEDNATLTMLLEHLNVPTVRGVAVAINDQVIPRSRWQETIVQENDHLEIIKATQGG